MWMFPPAPHSQGPPPPKKTTTTTTTTFLDRMLASELSVHMLKCIARGHVCCPLIHNSLFIHSFIYRGLWKMAPT